MDFSFILKGIFAIQLLNGDDEINDLALRKASLKKLCNVAKTFMADNPRNLLQHLIQCSLNNPIEPKELI